MTGSGQNDSRISERSFTLLVEWMGLEGMTWLQRWEGIPGASESDTVDAFLGEMTDATKVGHDRIVRVTIVRTGALQDVAVERSAVPTWRRAQ